MFKKITSRARYVDYEFLVTLVGLTSAHVAFIALMNKVSQNYLDKFIIILIDDILIYSRNKLEHKQHLRIALQTSKEKQLYAKLMKCEFWLEQVIFLVYVVSMRAYWCILRKLRVSLNGNLHGMLRMFVVS